MAWIMKNSAGTTIERRSEPYLSDALKAKIEAGIMTRYPTRRAATLPILRIMQETYHYVPHQAMEEIAEFVECSASEIYDTATFYEEFWFEPHGKYLIGVCRSISCELRGHEGLLAKLKEKLDVEEHETTEDGKFSLLALECLGSCGTAPCALVNDKLYENLTVESLDKIIDGLK